MISHRVSNGMSLCLNASWNSFWRFPPLDNGWQYQRSKTPCLVAETFESEHKLTINVLVSLGNHEHRYIRKGIEHRLCSGDRDIKSVP